MESIDISIIKKIISDFYNESKLNDIEEADSLKIYDEPIVKIASAEDPLFEQLKNENIAGSNHISPIEWLPGCRSVISFFLPYTKRVREANHSMGLPAREWLYGRYEGDIFNKAIKQYLTDKLIEKGYKAVSPSLDTRIQIKNLRSNWSERHVAYIAGIGTFGLSASLITEKGSAGRVGSVITDAEIIPTPRNYSEIYEYCNKCCACIRRCPPLAISENGKDHRVCSEYLDRVLLRYKPRYGCGKCQTAVPCENSIPRKKTAGS